MHLYHKLLAESWIKKHDSEVQKNHKWAIRDGYSHFSVGKEYGLIPLTRMSIDEIRAFVITTDCEEKNMLYFDNTIEVRKSYNHRVKQIILKHYAAQKINLEFVKDTYEQSADDIARGYRAKDCTFELVHPHGTMKVNG